MTRVFAAWISGTLILMLAGNALGVAVPDAATRLCADKLQNETVLYVNAVQKVIRKSIKKNLNGQESKGAGGFVCAGGANNSKACNPTCTAPGACTVGVCVGGPENGQSCENAGCPSGECSIDARTGNSGAIRKAAARLRAKIDQFCSDAQLLALFGAGGSERCPDSDTPADGLDTMEIVDCLLRGSSLEAPLNPVSEVLGRAAPKIAPGRGRAGGPRQGFIAPPEITLTSLGALTVVGTNASVPVSPPPGNPERYTVDVCVGTGTDCTLLGQVLVGNQVAPPVDTVVGGFSRCRATFAEDAGNGTSADGSFDFDTGELSLFTVKKTVVVAGACPRCIFGFCVGGPNDNLPCSAVLAPDIACPPAIGGEPELREFSQVDTEANAISVPAHNPVSGANNPAGVFCGSCDGDESVACDNDQDCVDQGVCDGSVVGSGCCVFGTIPGFFGDSTLTTVAIPGNGSGSGIPNPYLAVAGSAHCVGKSSPALNASLGLPGPAIHLQSYLISW